MKIVFFTYSDKKCSRLKYRAIETGWFDDVVIEYDFAGEKFGKILDELRKLEDEQALVFADQFCEINLNGRQYFSSNINKIKKRPIALYGEASSPFEAVMYLKKCEDSEAFLMKCIENGFKKAVEEFSKDIVFIKPSYDFFYCSQFKTSEEVRLAKSDFLPDCKRHYYKPYAMFIIGHELPCYETDLDVYTHFINVGKNDLQRCSANSGDSIKQYQELAELVGLYWAWKNIDMPDLKYVGFSTYRKPFTASNENMWKLLEEGKADCIANKFYSSFGAIHKTELASEAIDEFKSVLKEVLSQQECDNFINDYENIKESYICSSFVIKAEMFNELCENIFKIAIPLAERMRGKHGEKDHRPWSGCFAEAVTSYYIKKTFKNISSSAFFLYPKYSRLLKDDVASINPMIFGTLIENGNPLFFVYGEHPRKIDKPKDQPTDGFLSANDIKVKTTNYFALSYQNMNQLLVIHGGYTGDLMYAIPMLSELKESTKCGLKLHIKTNIKSELAFEHPNGNVRMTENAAKFIKPLLDELKLFDEVTYGDEAPQSQLKLDLSEFYKLPLNHAAGNMEQWYYNYVTTHLPQDFAKKRIEVEASDELKDKVVIVYSKRYVNENISLKPLEKFKDRFVFIGLDDEYETFKEKWFDLEYRKVSDALEFAKLLAGAKGIVANQTGLFSIAELMKVPRVLITTNSINWSVNVQPCGKWFEIVELQNKLLPSVEGLMKL